MDCIFFIIDTPMFEVISRTMLCLFVLIAFICNLIFLSLKLLKRHHSFLFLLNIPISFNVQMPNEVLTVWCCLVSVTLTRLVTFTYLQLWRLCHVFIRAGKIQFFNTQKTVFLRAGSGKCWDLLILCSL